MTIEKHYTPLSWSARLGLSLLFALMLLAGLVLSVFFFAFFVALALLGSVWLWWRRRGLRRQARSAQAEIIEGEYEVVEKHSKRDAKHDSEAR